MTIARLNKVLFILILSGIIIVVCNHGSVLGKKRADKDHPLVREIIPLPGRPMAMALSPDGALVAVLHSEGLSLVRLSPPSLVSTFPAHPTTVLPQLFFSNGGSVLYFSEQEDQVDRLDLGKDVQTPRSWISVPPGQAGSGGISGLALSPSERFLAMAVRGSDQVTVLDLARRLEVIKITGVKSPYGLVFSQDGHELWVGQECQTAQPGNPPSSPLEKGKIDCPPGMGFLSVVDLEHQRLEKRIEVGSHSGRFCLSKDGSRLFIAGTDELKVTTINALTQEVAEEISLQALLRGGKLQPLVALSLDPDGKRIYAALADMPWIAVIALGSQSSRSLKVEPSKVEGLIPVPGKPQAVRLDLQGTRLLVALSEQVDWHGDQPTPVQGPGAVAVIELPAARQWEGWLNSYLTSHS